MPRRSHRLPSPRSAARRRSCRPLVAALGVLTVLGALAAPGLTRAADTPVGATTGSFAFGGELRGTLKVPKTWNLGYTLTQAGCEKTVAKTSFNVFLYNVKLALNGHEQALTGGFAGASIMLNVAVQKYGDTESFKNQAASGGAPDFRAAVGLNVYAGHDEYSWETNAGSSTVVSSGTITTNAAGTGGSLSATLVPAGTGTPLGASSHATGLLTVRGSWTSCVQFKL